jgi:hypothetical protein
MSRLTYLLKEIGKQALEELWHLSSYSTDSLEEGDKLHRAANLSSPTFKKVVSFLNDKDDESVSLGSFTKLVNCLYGDCTENGQNLSEKAKKFIVSLREKDEHPDFPDFFSCSTIPKIKCNTEESSPGASVPKLKWEECCTIVPELLDNLDYANQQLAISAVFDSETAIAFSLTPECEWIEKWLLKRLQKIISDSEAKVVTFQACDGNSLNYQEICAEIDSQMGFSAYSSRDMNPKITIEKLIQASRTRMILIKVGKLRCDEYKVFIEKFYFSLKRKQILRDLRGSTKTGVAIIFHHCHEHVSYLESQGVSILPCIHIQKSDVKGWMEQANLQSGIKLSITDMEDWRYWHEDSRNTEQILKSICNSFRQDFDLDSIKDTLAKVG